MEGFSLVPLDGGSPIRLPEGETVLGRGPFLGVSDKRVSRHHGLIENLDGQLRIKSTHLNPCFCQSAPDDTAQPLPRDSWHPLQRGDIFSLLPGKCMYKVVCVGGAEGTPRNSQAFEVEEDVPKSPPVSPEPNVEPDQPTAGPPQTGQDRGRTAHSPETTLRAVEDEPHGETEEPDSPATSNKAETAPSKEMEEEEMNVTLPEPKRRVLPAWMMASAAVPQSPSPTAKGAGKKGKATSTTSTKAGTSKQARATRSSSGAESDDSEAEQRPRKRAMKRTEQRPRKRARASDEDEEAQSKAVTKARQPRVTNRVVGGEESDNFDMEVEEEEERDLKQSASNGNGTAKTASVPESKEQERKSKHGQPDNKAESRGSNGASGTGSAQPKAQLRMPCPYGKDCYRKNPLHFQESSHPGDSDYEEEEEEEEEDADRPECPYGTDCYRKNPLHRKEFKHSKRPARSTRTVPKKHDDDEDDDDVGYDDSFINDDSEDVGDDSDYVPPDSDNSGKEDVNRLQNEAKAFLKRRR